MRNSDKKYRTFERYENVDVTRMFNKCFCNLNIYSYNLYWSTKYESFSSFNYEGLKDLLVHKTVNWILFGIILSAIFVEIENSEPSSDFWCGSNGDNEEVIRLIPKWLRLYHSFIFMQISPGCQVST